ncbi:hypothetical protein Pelo_8887 [Pelomyxa schiedti]|nr:hypothetical protein Pelo_8887 [Pelomyxa schiedti]
MLWWAIFVTSTGASLYFKNTSRSSYWTEEDLTEMQEENDKPPSPFPPYRNIVFISISGVPWYIAQGENSLHDLLYHNATFTHDITVTPIDSVLPSNSDSAWATSVTGMSPEFSGFVSPYHGRKDFLADTVVRQAKRVGMPRSVIGDRIWPVSLSLEPFLGYGFVQVLEDTSSGWTNHALDVATQQVLVSLIESKKSTYFGLLLAAFTDTDCRAHEHGLDSIEYDNTLNTLTSILGSIFAAVDNTTVVVVSADHGHIPPGGHGGTERVVMQVPLILYAKDSGINSLPHYTGPPYTNITHRIHDVASTIALLTGTPPPAHSEGTQAPLSFPISFSFVGAFFSEALLLLNQTERRFGFQQLWKQKQSLCSYYMHKVNGDSATVPALIEEDLPERYHYDNEDAIFFYSGQLLSLEEVFADVHSTDMTDQVTLCASIAAVTSFVFLVLFVLLVWYTTYADIAALVVSSPNSFQNRIALMWALICWITYWALSFMTFLLLARYVLAPWGNSIEHWQWTISILNSREPSSYFLGGSFGLFFAIGLLDYQIFCRITQRSPAQFYLFRCYSSLLSGLSMAVLLSVAGGSHMYFSSIMHVTYITPHSWNLQFHVDCACIMAIPLTGLSISALYWCNDNIYSRYTLWLMHKSKRGTKCCRKSELPMSQNPPATKLPKKGACAKSVKFLWWIFLGWATEDTKKPPPFSSVFNSMTTTISSGLDFGGQGW